MSDTRIHLDRDQLLALPVKEVNRDELWEAMKKWEYNPSVLYAMKVFLFEGEMGHDRDYRYILK